MFNVFLSVVSMIFFTLYALHVDKCNGAFFKLKIQCQNLFSSVVDNSNDKHKRLRSVWKSKLYGGNLMKTISTSATSVVHYTVGIVKWTKE